MARAVRRVALLLAILFFPPSAGAQSYWAVQDGAVLTHAYGVTTVERSGDAVTHDTATLGYRFGRRYDLAEDGDVLIREVYGSFGGGLYESSTYDPPLLLLDLPLETGKTWTDRTTWHGVNEVYLVTVDGEVLGPTTTTVPGFVGEVPVVAVRVAWSYTTIFGDPVPADEEEVWLLHPQLGRVDDLLDWEGVVPDEPSTWGGVKALYR